MEAMMELVISYVLCYSTAFFLGFACGIAIYYFYREKVNG